MANLEAEGMIWRTELARGLVCDQCEESCWLQPRLVQPKVQEPAFVASCAGSLCAGLLQFEPDRLHRWRISLEGIARFLHRSLQLVGAVEERVPDQLWQVGEWRRGSGRRTLYFAWGFTLPDGDARIAAAQDQMDGIGPVLVVPHELPRWEAPGPVLALTRLLAEGETP